MDVDIGSSTVANGVLGLVIGVITTLVVDMAFLIQVCFLNFANVHSMSLTFDTKVTVRPINGYLFLKNLTQHDNVFDNKNLEIIFFYDYKFKNSTIIFNLYHCYIGVIQLHRYDCVAMFLKLEFL